MGLSLLVSFTVIPTAAARLFGGNFDAGTGRTRIDVASDEESEGDGTSDESAAEESSALEHGCDAVAPLSPELPSDSTGWLVRLLSSLGSRFAASVVSINRAVLASRPRSVALVIGMVLLPVGISYLLWPKVEYLPEGNRNFVFCSLSPPPGYNIEQLMAMGEQLETDLQPYWDVDPGSTESAQLEYPMVDYYFYAVRGTSVFMGFRAYDPSRIRELIPLLKDVGSQFPGTRAIAKQSSLFERGLTGGRTIDIEITGGDLNRLIAIGRRVLDDVKEIMPEAQAMPQPSLDLSSPEIHVQPKLVESAEMGVSAADLGYAVDAFVDGAYAGDYFVDGDKIDLTIVGDESFAGRTQDILSLPVADQRRTSGSTFCPRPSRIQQRSRSHSAS